MTAKPSHPYAPNMRRLVLAALTLALLVPAGAAQAADPTLAAQDAAQPADGGCTDVAFSYVANPPAGYSQVSVFLSVIDSSYNIAGYATFDGPSRSGVLRICNVTNRQYRLEMDVTACTSSYSSCQSYSGPPASFYVGPRPVTPPYVTPTPPTAPPVVTPPVATGPSARCVSAKKALKKAKAAHRSAAVKRAKAKVRRVC